VQFSHRTLRRWKAQYRNNPEFHYRYTYAVLVLDLNDRARSASISR
jgi:hypothetical protein